METNGARCARHTGLKRAKKHPLPKPRNPVARSPLLGKGGAHGKSNAAKRRQAEMELQKVVRQGEGG